MFNAEKLNVSQKLNTLNALLRAVLVRPNEFTEDERCAVIALFEATMDDILKNTVEATPVYRKRNGRMRYRTPDGRSGEL